MADLTQDQQAAADKAAADKAAADKAATDKAAADKAAADDKALDKFPPELQQHIRELRQENAKRREKEAALAKEIEERDKKLGDYAKAEEDRRRKQLEDEKKFEELAKNEREAREKLERESSEKLRAKDVAIIRSALRSYATELGIIDPDDVKDIDVRDMRVADDGSVPGSKEAVEALKAKKPHWFKEAGDKTGNRRATTTTPSGHGAGTGGEDARTWDKKTLNSRWGDVSRPA